MNLRVLQLFVFLILLSLSNQVSVRVAKACEGHTIKVHCPAGERIVILDADYGRWDSNACPYYEDPNMRTDCHSTTAAEVAKISCNGKQFCRMKAENTVFTDPCPGQVKHAEVHFICVPIKPSLVFNGENSLLDKLYS